MDRQIIHQAFFSSKMTAREAFWDTALLSWLLLVFMQGLVTTRGQGVYLQLNGMRLQNDSLVDIDDIPDELTIWFDDIYIYDELTDGFEMARDTGLTCVTDRRECCDYPRRGEWYHPDGSPVTFNDGSQTFCTYRGQRRIYLWRVGNPVQRGRFRCELPDASNVNQNRYVNILDIGAVSVFPAGNTTGTVGENFNLQCSVDINLNPLPQNVPTPSFEWFFGPNNDSLPSGVAVSSLTSSGNTYTSTLQFTPLQESHAGMYTCRLGGNAKLANNKMITVNRPSITVTMTHDREPELESMYVLTCALSGTDRLSPTITYQWTRDNGTTQTVGTNSSTLFFSPSPSLSDAGQYTCNVSVSSPYLNSTVLESAGNSQTVTFQVPNPTVTINSNPPPPILEGTDVTLTCSVTMGQGVLPSDLSLLMVDTQLSRDGTTLDLTGPVVSGTTFTYTIQLDSFGRNDSGIYACIANVTLLQPSTYLAGMGVQYNTITIIPVVAPPLNVQASQSSASAPVEVSWSPPSGGTVSITNYRIFYGNGQNVSVAPIFTGVALNINKDAVGQTVSIRSEADQLASELINVTITDDLTKFCFTMAEVGITVGVSILLLSCLVAVVITALTLIYCLRKEKTSKTFTDVSRNMTQSVYEEPDKFASSSQGNYELTECPAYGSTTSKPQPLPTEAQSGHYEM